MDSRFAAANEWSDGDSLAASDSASAGNEAASGGSEASSQARDADSRNLDTDAPRRIVKPLTKKKLEKYREIAGKRGVVYIARVPPYMKPEKVRHLFGKYGEVLRIYLTPEDPLARNRRVKTGGNRKQNYTDGWVEFASRRVAKRVAEMLNCRPIGGSKRSFYHDDMWNLRYLKKFKWDDLTAELAYKNRVRDEKLKLEMEQVRRENNHYLSRVEKARTIGKIADRKRAKVAETGDSKALARLDQAEAARPPKRAFSQREAPVVNRKKETTLDRGLLAQVFGGAKKRRKGDA